MITIQVTGFLTDFTGGKRTIVLDGSPQTVAEALSQLWTRHAGLRDRVVTERGQLRPHVGIFVNADHIRHRQELDTAVADGDDITILPAISGGSRSSLRPPQSHVHASGRGSPPGRTRHRPLAGNS